MWRRGSLRAAQNSVPRELLGVATSNISANPAQVDRLRPTVHTGYVQAFSHSLDTVLRIGVIFCLVGFVLSLFRKEVPLRDRDFVGSQQGALAEV